MTKIAKVLENQNFKQNLTFWGYKRENPIYRTKVMIVWIIFSYNTVLWTITLKVFYFWGIFSFSRYYIKKTILNCGKIFGEKKIRQKIQVGRHPFSITNHQSTITNNQSPITNHQSSKFGERAAVSTFPGRLSGGLFEPYMLGEGN
jgi:hypothetical protein